MYFACSGVRMTEVKEVKRGRMAQFTGKVLTFRQQNLNVEHFLIKS
jgi:hypothetical protein